MEQFLRAIVDRSQESIEGISSFVIGINGLDCSGKTSLAIRLHQKYLDMGCKTGVIHIDDFCDMPTIKSVYGHYHENGSDDALVLNYYENFVINKDLVNKLEDYRKKYKFVIVEGIFLFNLIPHNVFDFKIYLDIDETTAFERYKKRKLINGASLPDAIFNDIWLAAHLVYCEAVNPKNLSDVVLHSGKTPHVSSFSNRAEWLAETLPMGRFLTPFSGFPKR